MVLHPLEGIRPARINGQLAGALLISPWISFKDDSPSWKENLSKDVVGHECLHLLTDAYVDPKHYNNYSEPAQADASWWHGIPVKSILTVYGAYEVFTDAIFELGQKLKESGNAVQIVSCPLQVHIDCFLDAQSGLEPAEMSQSIWDWMSAVF